MRGLAHRGHWQGPLGPFFERFGAVKASPMAAYRLLNQGEAVLLYPGGGKEVSWLQGETRGSYSIRHMRLLITYPHPFMTSCVRCPSALAGQMLKVSLVGWFPIWGVDEKATAMLRTPRCPARSWPDTAAAEAAAMTGCDSATQRGQSKTYPTDLAASGFRATIRHQASGPAA